jgi:hypothetical protein
MQIHQMLGAPKYNFNLKFGQIKMVLALKNLSTTSKQNDCLKRIHKKSVLFLLLRKQDILSNIKKIFFFILNEQKNSDTMILK